MERTHRASVARMENSESISYAREIARRGTVDTLQGMGYDADLLVPETTDISLVERVRRANAACTKHGTPNVVLVSIHCNAAGNGSRCDESLPDGKPLPLLEIPRLTYWLNCCIRKPGNSS